MAEKLVLSIEADAVGILMSTDFTELELGTSSNLIAAFEAAFAALWDPANTSPQGTLRHSGIVLLSDSSQSVHPAPSLSVSLHCALLMIRCCA